MSGRHYKSVFLVTGDEVLGWAWRRICAWNFRANESNQVYLNCRVPPKISKKRHYAIGHGQYHWRTAFQAEHLQWLFPRTSSPVIVACSVLPFRQLIRSAYSCGLFNLCVEVVFVMQMQIYNFVPIKCAYTENFKAAIFCFQGDIFFFLLESFHYPVRKFLLQSL